MRRIIIAGTHSGCGKTTVTCAILSAMVVRGLKVSSFKCGCDYIDPMFHEQIICVKSHNLDSFFCDVDTLKNILHENGKNSDISVIEGVMGFYDGVNGSGSAHSVSEITETPVILVIDCKGMSDSIGAVISGFLHYKPNRITGIIFNRLPEKLIPLAEKICQELGTEYLGRMPVHSYSIASRHLGLVTAEEISDIKEKIHLTGELAEKNIMIDRILEISDNIFPEYNKIKINKIGNPVIAIARDKAFCFIYRDNIEILEKMGCKIEYFSPMNDGKIPENADGLILYGGYPELYAEKLSGNVSMIDSVRKAVNSGIPVIAECGGFMYLHEFIDNFSMVGVLDGMAYRTDKLQRFGYITLKSDNESLLFRAGGKIPAHEFHYWDTTNNGDSLTAEKSDGRNWKCVVCTKNMYAGFPHIYFYSDIETAERFVKKCMEYGGKK
ncbi:MAG: cobyrinate a,c-diamide synthase [Muribaculaceae bacterium]|nr:cobyrinate a,c-diamide synthase [Alistipes senegalensis]MCM1472670.1 cobyrinate a,c-diamide synthase [Muribaculaceae bacterium]